MGPRPIPPHIILVRPQEQGNVGATARAMANMGLETMILVEPAVEIGPTARAFAVGAHAILESVRRAASLGEALAPYRRAVGTTSTRDRRIASSSPLLTARELPAFLAADPPGTPTALVFGPEPSGMTAEELALLSPLVRIPCAPVQPTLNLAQAVLILTYELFLDRGAGNAELRPGAVGAEAAATSAEIGGLFEHLREVLEAVGFARDDTFEAVVRDLRRLASRAALTGREVTLLRGICRRTLHAVARRGS